MEFHTISAKGAAHIMTTHRGEVDETPLQMISAQRLAYLQALEAGLQALAAMVDPLLHVADSPAPVCSSDCSTPGS